MIITIKGKQGEGKTALVKTILRKKKAIFIDQYDLKVKDWLLELDDSIDFLVVDEVTKMKKTKLFLERNVFKVRKPYTEGFTDVKLPPNIILIKQG